MKPRFCVLRTDGTNCDRETAFAVELAGGHPELIHVNAFRDRSRSLRDFQGLVIPGGFSYGDDVASGKILAVELSSFFRDSLEQFVEQGKPVLGICNGFQVLVQTGLLPWGQFGRQSVALAENASGRFQCEWVDLDVGPSACVFTCGMPERISLQIAHGEGRVVWHEGSQTGLVPVRYASDVNGSDGRIAGICNSHGNVFGLMPHPERFVLPQHHPNWRRGTLGEPHGLSIFRNGVVYAAGR